MYTAFMSTVVDIVTDLEVPQVWVISSVTEQLLASKELTILALLLCALSIITKEKHTAFFCSK